MLNGNGAVDTSTHRLLDRVRNELSSSRLDILVSAVDEHRERATRLATGRRPHDETLYRRLAEILAGSRSEAAR
jgi:hypothetical protein